MKRRAIFIGIGAIVLVVSIVLIGWLFATWRAPVPVVSGSSCQNCHGDKDRLAGLSEQPDKYFVDPAQFSKEAHAGLACTTCHGGDATKDTPQEACLNGHAYKNPAATEVVSKTCGTCHSEITQRSLQSIHTSLDGIRLSLVDLMGAKDGTAKFQATCNDCHTTCSSCHMENPDRRNMLWANVTSHHFAASSNSKNCVACHAGMGDTFFGTTTAPKHAPSVMAQAGMQCVDCHGDMAVHGNGVKVSFSMQSPKPTCQECHNQATPRITSAKNTLVAPQYSSSTPAHQMHSDSAISCEACHTEWYPSCWNCHDGKQDKSTQVLYLAVDPLSHKITPAAHSPATTGPTGLIPSDIGGGWAIKTRHSWGASQTCETCHTKADIYITGVDRTAPFVGFWAANRSNASFVDEKLVQILLIDPNKLKQSAHKDQTCNDCHQSLTDAVCADCHAKTLKTGKTVLPADGDWSRASYVAAKQNLDQSSDLIQKAKAAGTNVADWERQWSNLDTSYLQMSNEFHANPGLTLAQIKTIGSNSQALLNSVQSAQALQTAQNQALPAGVLFFTGAIGALALGLVVRRQQKG